MSKSLINQFQSRISPFSDASVKFCLKALFESGAVQNVEDAVDKLLVIVDRAVANGDYNDYYDANIYEIFLDYQKESNFLDKVAKIIAKRYNYGEEVRNKIDYQENAGIDYKGENHFLYSIDFNILDNLSAMEEVPTEELRVIKHFLKYAETASL